MIEGYDPLKNNKRLVALKAQHRLTTEEIADLIGAKYETVKNWVKKTDPPKCPSYAVELLEIKVSKGLRKTRRKAK